jgi:hypothetical protein
MARALLSGVQTDAAKSFINRVRAAQGEKEDTALTRMFAQITLISSRRNDLLHFRTNYTPDANNNFLVDNSFHAHIPESRRSFPISSDLLEKMSEDLSAITAGLTLFMLRDKKNEDMTELSNPATALLQALSRVPWQYISDTPVTPPKGSRNKNSTLTKKVPKKS